MHRAVRMRVSVAAWRAAAMTRRVAVGRVRLQLPTRGLRRMPRRRRSLRARVRDAPARPGRSNRRRSSLHHRHPALRRARTACSTRTKAIATVAGRAVPHARRAASAAARRIVPNHWAVLVRRSAARFRAVRMASRTEGSPPLTVAGAVRPAPLAQRVRRARIARAASVPPEGARPAWLSAAKQRAAVMGCAMGTRSMWTAAGDVDYVPSTRPAARMIIARAVYASRVSAQMPAAAAMAYAMVRRLLSIAVVAFARAARTGSSALRAPTVSIASASTTSAFHAAAV